MQLTIQIPVLVAEIYGKYKNRITYTTRLQPILTSVSAIRRVEGDDVAIEVDAFIPEQYRDQIDGSHMKWISPEMRRCVCYIDDNRKTLRDFIESGEQERQIRN
jgi:hypothetical protein